MLLPPTYQGQRVHIVSGVLCGHSSEEVVSQPSTYNFFWAQDPELDPLHVPERSRRVDGRHFSTSRQGDGETEHGWEKPPPAAEERRFYHHVLPRSFGSPF